MTTLIPLLVSLLIWLALWMYIFKLDRRVKKLEKNA